MSDALFIGKYHISLDVIDSTNAYLQSALESGRLLPEGTAVSANYQLQGRGQRGTIWQSKAEKNILLSILLYPRFLKADEQFILSQTIALAVYDAVKMFLDDNELNIKWPNDILAGNKKICGILIENNIQGSYLKSSVIGIGLNVNEECAELPQATSIKLLSGKNQELEKVREKLFSTIEARYLVLRQDQREKIRKEYLDKIYCFGQELCFFDHLRDQKFMGKICGISKEGKLQLQTSLQTLEFGLKEISFL